MLSITHTDELYKPFLNSLSLIIIYTVVVLSTVQYADVWPFFPPANLKIK